MKAFALVVLLLFALDATASAEIDVALNPNGISDVPPIAFGDPTPGFEVDSWIQGGPERPKRGTVRVVFFFSSTSAASRMSIPRLNQLHNDLGSRGLCVIGIAFEDDGGAHLRGLIKSRAENMNFPVALASEATHSDWLRAARVRGLPWVFITARSGHVAWWGRPFDESFEGTLRQALDDKHQIIPMRVAFMHGKKARAANWDRQDAFWTAWKAQQWDRCLQLVDEIIGTRDGAFSTEATAKFELFYDHTGEKKRALRYANHNLEGPLKNEHVSLTTIADVILRDADATGTALATAFKLARRAEGLTLGQDADVLATVARAHYAQGDKQQAAAVMKKAIAVADSHKKSELQKQLASLE